MQQTFVTIGRGWNGLVEQGSSKLRGQPWLTVGKVCRFSSIGRVQQLAIGQLWVQECIRQAAFTLHKVRADCNPADLCTKHLGCTSDDHRLRIAGLHFEAGRASSAPLLSASVELLRASL